MASIMFIISIISLLIGLYLFNHEQTKAFNNLIKEKGVPSKVNSYMFENGEYVFDVKGNAVLVSQFYTKK